jgi:hypothetical protein
MEFSIQLPTMNYLKFKTTTLQGLWTKTLCENPVTHNIVHIQCNRMVFHMHNIHNH